MPGIHSDTILDNLRRSCHNVVEEQGYVKVQKDMVGQTAQQLSIQEVKESCKPNLFPIKFDDVQSEVNFLALYHLLDFGSGYDPLLMARMRRQAHEMIQFGVLGMALSDQRLDNTWMRAFNTYSIHNYFGLEAMEEQPLPNLPGVTITKPGPLAPLAEQLQRAIVDTGHTLESLGERNLGSHIMAVLDTGAASGRPVPAAALVQDLAESYPAFYDAPSQGVWELPFHRKAQNLVADLYLRFGSTDRRFGFPDASKLTADSGNVVAAVLRSMGVLHYDVRLDAVVDRGELLPQGPQELAIRAATVVAVDSIVEATGGAISALQLNAYLKLKGEAEGSALRVHNTPGSTAY